MQDAQQEQGFTVAEAAAHLGVSSDTVRRRIRRGDVRAVQVPTPNGPAWRVLLGSAPTLDSALGSAPSSPNGEAGYLADLVRQLAERAEANAAAAAMWQARAEHLATQLEQAQRALPAGDRPETRTGEPPAIQASEAVKRAWWQFWTRGRAPGAVLGGKRRLE